MSSESGIVDSAASGGGSSTGPGSGADPAGTGPGLAAEPGLRTDPDDVEPGRMAGQDAPPAANQQKTEPMPPSAGQDVATAGEPVVDEGAGTSTGPGPRMGAPGASPASPGASGASALSPEGQRPEEARPSPGGSVDPLKAPHDPGRVESDLPGTASRVPGVQGESPQPFGADTAAGAASMGSAAASGSQGESGDANEVNVPSETSAEGTSESMEPVDGVRLTAVAPEGHADGEPDTRVPPTTTF
jgi:hypothetical protein